MRRLCSWPAAFGLGSLLVAFGAAALACSGDRDGDEGVGSAHTLGQLEWANAAAPMWIDLDKTKLDALFPRPPVPANHPVEARVDAWVKHFDGIARTIISENGVTPVAPAPYARLIVMRDSHPWGTRAATCVAGALPETAGDGGLGLPGAHGDAGGEVVALDASAPDGDASVFVPVQPPKTAELAMLMTKTSTFNTNLAANCMRAPGWTGAEGLRFFNSLGGYQVTDRGENGFIDTTLGGTVSAPPIVAHRVAMRSAAPAINLTTQMIAGLSENAVAIAVAREIGRYHRAHETTGVADKYDFVYERSDVEGRPQPVAEQNDLLQQFTKVRFPRFSIPTQQFHPRVAPTLLRWLNDHKFAPGHPCWDAQRYLQLDTGLAREELTEGFAESNPTPLSSIARLDYLKLEPRIATCIAGVEIPEDAPAPSLSQPIPSNLTKLPRRWFIESIEPPLVDAAATADFRDAVTLKDLVTKLEDLARGIDAQATELEKKLRDNRISRYTTAQEADEVGLELAVRSGISPRRVFAGLFELMALEEKQDPGAFSKNNASVSSYECKAWFDRGFRELGPDGKARDVYVPGGMQAEPAWCARIYSLLRDVRQHRYTPQSLSGPWDEPTWPSMQQQALALMTSAPPGPPPDEPPPEEQDGGLPPITDGGPDESADAGKHHAKSDASDSEANQGEGEGEWEEDGWTPPEDPAPAAKKKTPAKKSTGCSVGPTEASSMLPFASLVALALIARRRRR